MIRKPLTIITINNDPTANALKPGTEQLIKGFKESNKTTRSLATRAKRPYSRKKEAAYLRKQRSEWNSAGMGKVLRGGYKNFGS